MLIRFLGKHRRRETLPDSLINIIHDAWLPPLAAHLLIKRGNDHAPIAQRLEFVSFSCAITKINCVGIMGQGAARLERPLKQQINTPTIRVSGKPDYSNKRRIE